MLFFFLNKHTAYFLFYFQYLRIIFFIKKQLCSAKCLIVAQKARAFVWLWCYQECSLGTFSWKKQLGKPESEAILPYFIYFWFKALHNQIRTKKYMFKLKSDFRCIKSKKNRLKITTKREILAISFLFKKLKITHLILFHYWVPLKY